MYCFNFIYNYANFSKLINYNLRSKLTNMEKLNKYYSEKIKVYCKNDRLYYVKLIFCYNFGIGG